MTQKDRLRLLTELTREELIVAMAEMCRRLNIPGSRLGEYNLYDAVIREWEKAKAEAGLWKTPAGKQKKQDAR